MDWILSVKSYVNIVDEGSFNGAARRMNTTSSAISKRIHWLEEKIGVQLLKRTTRSVIQTEEGALFYQRARAQLDDWQSIIDETRSVSQTPAGVLKIGTTLTIGSKFLVQYLNDFLQAYPDIRIHLVTTPPGELPSLTLDLFISREIEQLNSLSFKATPLFKQKVGFYASPEYVKLHGEPKSHEELSAHKLLIWGETIQREISLISGEKILLNGNFVTTNPEALFHAAKSGMGLLLSNDAMIIEDIKAGKLIRILPDITVDESTVYAYYPKLDYQHTRTKLFLDYLQTRLAKQN